MVQIPYKDYSYSMNIFLPKIRFGLENAVMRMTADSIYQLLSTKNRARLHLKFPKWNIESTLGLDEVLQQLGVKDVFQPSKADFGNMDNEISFLSKSVHKTLIEVDENGTIGASATFTVRLGSRKPPIEFTADHPFMFILAKDTHPLFVGFHN